MALAEQFELLELIQRDKAETWLAMEKGAKRQLLLHRFREDTGLRQRLLSMGPEDLIMLVGAEREGDSYVVVTHDLPPLRAFSRWVQERSDAAASRPQPAAPQQRPQEKASSERYDPDRTQLMTPRVPETKLGAREIKSNPAPAPPEPGEFTRLFTATSPAQTERTATPPRSPSKAEPGEFTRMFEAVPSPKSEPKSPPLPPPKTEPGEFTKLFYAPPKPVGEVSEPAIPAPSSPKPKTESPGDFTMMFEGPLAMPSARDTTRHAEPSSLPAPPQRASKGDFTGVFGPMSHDKEPEPKFDLGRATGIFEKPQSPQPTPPAPPGPSDYTVFLQAPPTPPPPAEPPKGKDEKKAPESVEAPRSAIPVLLVVVLALLLMAALGLLLFFFLKR